MSTPETAAPRGLEAFLARNPEIDLVRFDFNDPEAVATLRLPEEDGEGSVAAARAFQRVLRVTGDDDTARRLLAAGFDSAQRIALPSEQRFVRENARLFAGGADEARKTHQRAAAVKAQVQHVAANAHAVAGSPHFRAMLANPGNGELAAYFTSVPSYADLFGPLDYCACDHDASIFSPAAYLLDLMRITEEYITDPNTHKQTGNIPPGYMLRERRPDLFQMKLDPANTTTLVPLLSIVNNVLERRLLTEQRVDTGTAQGGGAASITLATSASGTDGAYVGMEVMITAGTGVGQSCTITAYAGATRIASVASAWSVVPDATSVYVVARPPLQTVAAAPYPFNLPANLPLTEVRASLSALGASQAEVYAALGAPLAGGQAQGGTATTLVLAQGASDQDGAYDTLELRLVGGTGAGQASDVSSYAGATRTATLTQPLHVLPDATTQYQLYDPLPAAREVLALSMEAYALVTTPVTDPQKLAPYYGASTLDVAALSRVAVFLEKTGLTRTQLVELLTQELSTAEIEAGVAESFFINDTGESLPAMQIVTDESDPENPFERISDLSVKRLDRLNRFIRLSAWSRWPSYASLDWAMRSVSAGEIDRASVIQLSRIRLLQAATTLDPVTLAALWYPMKTIGKGNGPVPIDLFDRTYNPTSLLAGEDPYTSVTPIPFDPARPLAWTIDDGTGANGVIRGRLRGALGVSDDDLTRLAQYVRALLGGAAGAALALNLEALSWLFRLATAASVFQLSVDEYLALLGLMYYPDQPYLLPPPGIVHPTPAAALAQLDRVRWFASTRFTVYSARYVVNGESGPSFTPPYDPAGLAAFINSLATLSEGARVTSDAFTFADIDEAASAEIFARLVSSAFLTGLGIVLSNPDRWYAASAQFPLTAASFERGPVGPAQAAEVFRQLQESQPPILVQLRSTGNPVVLAPGFDRETDLSFLLPNQPGADNQRNEVRSILLETKALVGIAEFSFLFPLSQQSLAGTDVPPAASGQAFAELEAHGVLVADPAGGQSRKVTAYDGAARVATVAPDWATQPGHASRYQILAQAAAGTARAATLTSLTLATDASTTDGAYTGFELVITSGAGSGQRRIITLYDGPSRECTLASAWTVLPDATSAYVISQVVTAGVARGGAAGTVRLANAASSTDGAYVGMTVELVASATLSPHFDATTTLDYLFASAGAGQTQDIAAYDGPTRTATVGAAWNPVPDATTVYVVTQTATRGTARAGSAATIQLAEAASSGDDAYTGLEIALTGGTGNGQRRAVTSYVGATRTATVSPAWETAPDDTSAYAVTQAANTGTARGGDATHLALAADASAEPGTYVGLPLALVPDPMAAVRQDAVRQRLLALRADIAFAAALMDQAESLQEANAVQGLAGFLHTTADRLAALIPFATQAADLSDYVDDLLTPIPRGQVPANVPPFVAALARGLVLADTLGYSDVEIGAAVARPQAFNLTGTQHVDFAGLRSLSTYKRLQAAFGDDRGALLAYFALPPDAGCPGGVPGAQVRALAELAGWPAAQVCTLVARFWPAGMGATAYGYATVDGVARLATAFALGERTGMEVATLLALDTLAVLPLVVNGSVQPAAWQTYVSLAGVVRAAVRAGDSGGAPGASATAMAELSRGLDEQERDALAPYTLWLLGQQYPSLRRQSDLYQYLLIDVGMSGCDSVSPIAEGIAAVQLYMQRCRLMLEPGVTDLSGIPDVWWEWMSGYRLWEANRKVFLYPENYVDPARRSDATPQYRELVDDLLQTDITEQAVTGAYEGYFAGFAEVAGLTQCASYTCRLSLDGGAERETLFVFGRTAAQPFVWYWRRFDGLFAWSPWEKIGLSIASRFVTPVYAFKRLFLFWTEAKTVDGSRIASSSSETISATTATLKFSFLNDDLTWAAEQTLDDVVVDYRIQYQVDPEVMALLPLTADQITANYDPDNVWYRKVYALYAPDVNATSTAYPRGEQLMLSYGWALYFQNGPTGPTPSAPDPQQPAAQYRFQYDAWSLVNRYNQLRQKTPAPNNGFIQPVLSPAVDAGLTPSTYATVLINQQPLLNAQPYFPLMNRTAGSMGVSQSTSWNPILDNFYADDEPGVVSITAGTPELTLLQNISGQTAAITTVKNRVGSFLFDNGDETYLVVSQEQGIHDLSELVTASSSLVPYPAVKGWMYLLTGSYTSTPAVWDKLAFAFYRLSTSTVEPLSRKLRLGGIPALLTLESQETPELPFSRLQPVSGKAIPPASDKLDFDGAYGEYFWEIFFHAPFLVGDSLGLNRRYAEAKRWYEYIFNPTQQPAAGDPPHDTTRFWRFLPFRSMDVPTLTQILTNPAQIAAYNNRPFDPDAIARLRISAYAKAVVMHYIDNLLKWADDLFALDTRESITQATQLYVLAADLLGPRPENLGPCDTPEPMSFDQILAEYSDRTITTGTAQGGAARSITLAATASNLPDAYTGMYVSITAGTGTGQTNYVTAYQGSTRVATVELPWATVPDATSQYRVYVNGIPQFLIRLENSGQLVTPPAGGPSYQGVPFNDLNAYFCVPENEELVAYWDKVEDRLFKIRHCMNLEGQVRSLALFAPPIDPRALIRAAASGALGGLSALAAGDVPIPFYRFTVMLEKARALTGLVMQLGASLLAALEKQDAAALQLLRTSQERALLDLTTLIKEQQITEAEQTGLALQESQKSAQHRYDYYVQQLARGLSPSELLNIASSTVATVFNVLAGATRTAASIGYAVPQVGSPFAMTYGGQQIGSALTAASGVFEIYGMLANFAAQMALTMAGYQRRADEWQLQADLAAYDRDSMGYQIAANQARQQIVRRELEVHQATLRQNAEMEAFLTRSFTGEELYRWMAARLSTVYFQTYSLAFALARSAERAWQFELGSSQTFVNFGYWDSLRKGLLAGEGLMLALSQMEKAYLDGTPRPLEIEKTVSLLQLNPRALLDLVRTGECMFELPEKLFDLDFPGHYARTLKTVSISIPAVLGPYQNVHATLTQLSSQVVLKPDVGAVKYLLAVPGAALPGPAALRSNGWVNQQIALSRGTDDSGVFVLSYGDERYLPFEGTGAVSTWRLSLPRATNRFDFSAITDVVVNLKYTARDGGARFRQEVTSLAPLRRLDGSPCISMAQVFSTQWYDFLHLHPDPTTQTLSFDLAGLVPPHLGDARLTGFFVQLDLPAGVRGSGSGPYLRLRLGAGVDVSFNLDAYNRYLHTFQATPSMARVQGPGSLAFTLAQTPSALKGADGYLDPAVLRNVALILFYSADMQW